MRWTVYFDSKYLPPSPPFSPSAGPIERRQKIFPMIEARGQELASELKQAWPAITVVKVFNGILGCEIEIPEGGGETLLTAILERFDSEVLPAVTGSEP